MFRKIQKRDGNVVDFDSSKIASAIGKAGEAAGELDLGPLPSVENIQDVVERVLFATPYKKIKFT